VDEVEKRNKLNSYATPTPIMEDDRVYVTFGGPGTACLSAKTGEVIWQRTDINVTYHNIGPASTPSIHKNMLIMICDGGRESERFVVALDKMTGQTLWKTDRTYKDGNIPKITHSFCVPLAITVDGKDQIVCPGAHGVYAYDLETGKEIWLARYDGWSVVSRPVYANGMLYICSGVVKPMMYCINPKGAKGDISETDKIIWKTKKMVPKMPSPLLVNNRFYTMTSNKLACRKPATGEIIWNEHISGQHLASPVYADGAIYLFDQSGGSTVVNASDTFQMISTNRLESGCMASPAIYDKSLIVRTATHLYRIEE
jgi:outer membrane protein assembly factor BamB